VRIPETDLATYPDLSVVCGQLRRADDDPDAILNPVLIVEVLSDSTEAYDRDAKWAHDRRIASLCDYVLVSQGEPLVEVYRRIGGGRFELFESPCRRAGGGRAPPPETVGQGSGTPRHCPSTSAGLSNGA
jgi:Uma2 family endonuclease